MTTWTEPFGKRGRTERSVGPFDLFAYADGPWIGSWNITTHDRINDLRTNHASGTAPDLASAQAAADAAVEAIYAAMGKDLGLVFVRTTGDPDYPTALRALGPDGMCLYVVDRVGDEFLFGTLDPLRVDLVEWNVGKFATESDAIAAARAHDAARRGTP